MTTKIVTPPVALAVSLEAAKLSLREDGTDKDALISAWISGITNYAEHYTGRSFVNRQVRATLNEFPAGAIFLDAPPLVSVNAIRYYDENGTLQTLDPQDYVVDIESEPGNVAIADGLAWPLTLPRSGSVMVDYTAGYGVSDSSIPEDIKLYILAKLAEQFDQGDWVKKDTVQSSFIDRLLDPKKMYS